MKVAFIKKRFSLHGGAERYLQTLISHLRDSGHEIQIFSGNWAEGEGIAFHRIPVLPLGSLISTLSFNHSVKKALQRGLQADCVVSFERTTCQDIYRAGDGCHREWLKLREVIEPGWRRWTFRVNPLHAGLLALERKLFLETKLIIANSAMVKDQIIRHYGLPEDRIRIIYNGVDLSRFSPSNRENWRDSVRRELSLPENSRVILFVGSGFERKGLSALIRAAGILIKTMGGALPEIHILVAGKGNPDKFRSLAGVSGIGSHLHFIGPQKEIERFYAASDVFVLPTIYDPFSNATLEAMAAGLPVITTLNNGVSEIMEDGVDGFLLKEVLDYNGLARKIEQALSRCLIMGENARRTAEKYPIGKAAGEFMSVITGFLAEKRGR